jgi:probable phosphoglycerate mutase
VLYLLRHGETEWSRTGRKQGRGDSPLTAHGVCQVEACARLLAQETAGRAELQLVTSPLGRARASAEIVRLRLGLPEAALRVDELLAEHDYGAWEGLTNAEIEERFPGQQALRRRQHWSYVVPGGESYALVARRAQQWLARQDPSQTVIAVAHDMVSRVLRGLYLNLPSSAALALDHPHTRIYVLERGLARALEVAPVDDRADP